MSSTTLSMAVVIKFVKLILLYSLSMQRTILRSITLNESGGTVASTTVYVRLAATQASTGAKSGDVTISGGGGGRICIFF